jgi:hypothetical protein
MTSFHSPEITMSIAEEPTTTVAVTQPSPGLEAFRLQDTAIAQLSQEFMPMTVLNAEDKEGFERVHRARMLVKKHRTQVELVRKGLNQDALAWQKKVNSEAKRITALLEPIEQHLIDEEAKWEKWRDEIRNAERLRLEE